MPGVGTLKALVVCKVPNLPKSHKITGSYVGNPYSAIQFLRPVLRKCFYLSSSHPAGLRSWNVLESLLALQRLIVSCCKVEAEKRVLGRGRVMVNGVFFIILLLLNTLKGH